MKRKIQKLALTKETLRSLEENNLGNVAGGVTGVTCPVMSCQVECTNATRVCSVCCP